MLKTIATLIKKSALRARIAKCARRKKNCQEQVWVSRPAHIPRPAALTSPEQDNATSNAEKPDRRGKDPGAARSTTVRSFVPRQRRRKTENNNL
ncbi:hypothetical protein [Paracidovorax citrulli]